MSDIMDEFEFKPLTEGLGFQKRPNQAETKAAKTTVLPSTKATANLTQSVASAAQSANSAAQTAATNLGGLGSLSTPLPRRDVDSSLTKEVPSTTVDEILKSLNSKKRPEFANTEAKPARTRIETGPQAVAYRASQWDTSSFLLDAMLVTAMNLVCLIALLVTTKIDLFANLFNPETGNAIYWSLVGLVLSTTWIYLVATRMFLGSTPGEWVFDQRLGAPEEVGTAMYSLLVMTRASLVVFTGLILFPFLSIVQSKDVLGQLMGLELLKKS